MKVYQKALVVAGLCVSMAAGLVGCGSKTLDGSQTVATVGEKTATYVVDVKQPLTSISLNKATGSLIAEREELLTVTYDNGLYI